MRSSSIQRKWKEFVARKKMITLQLRTPFTVRRIAITSQCCWLRFVLVCISYLFRCTWHFQYYNSIFWTFENILQVHRQITTLKATLQFNLEKYATHSNINYALIFFGTRSYTEPPPRSAIRSKLGEWETTWTKLGLSESGSFFCALWS